MNDFDFDELDKAVSALATKTHDEHGGPDPSQPRPLVAQPTPASEPAAAPIQQAAPQGPTTQPPVDATPPSAPAKHRLSDTPRPKRAFMDIVPPARKPVARVGVQVQPVSKIEDIVPEEPKKSEPKPEPETPVPSPDQSAAPSPVQAQPVEHAQPAKDDVQWPDPLDFHDSPVPQQEPESPAESEPEPAHDQEADQSDQPTDGQSPFLAEAKVEKRPLGAFSDYKPAEEPSKPEETPAEPEPQASQDELTPEKDGTFKEPEQPKAPTAPTSAEATQESSGPDVHGTAMMSIPQQYHTEAKETDKTARPVYDTKEYHPPLLEATNEHRGGGMWGKLFIALVVLALLGVGGYFAYLYLLPR